MMVWSKTSPSVDGWYWYRLRKSDAEGFPKWIKAECTQWHSHSEFGPRIPSPEAIEAAKDALRYYADYVRALEGRGDVAALHALTLDGGKRATSALAKLGDRP